MIYKKLHIYLSIFVIVQLSFWIISGTYFSLVPFNSVIKSKDILNLSKLKNNSNLSTTKIDINSLIKNYKNISEIKLINWYNNRAVYEIIDTKANIKYIDAISGKFVSMPTKKDILNIAKSIYIGKGSINSIKLITKVKKRLLIVKEVSIKDKLWLVSFNDSYSTRLYFNTNGSFKSVRNDYWVIYDFFWRLHILDFANGEDFNNTILRISTVVSFIFLIISILILIKYFRRSRS